MAWEISMSAEGWANVTRNVYAMTAAELVTAIVDDEFEAQEDTVDDIDAFVAAHKQNYAGQAQDILARHALDLIQQHNTCDNGGHAVWIDRQGYQTVPVSLTDGGAEINVEDCC